MIDPLGRSLSIVRKKRKEKKKKRKEKKEKKREEEGCPPYSRATHSAELRRVSRERSRDRIPVIISLIIFYCGFGIHNGIDYLIGQRSHPWDRVQREHSTPIVQHCE